MTTCQFLSQFHPPRPTFTEAECPDQSGKVFIVTGGYSGVGYELVKILYQKNANIYIFGRSEEKAILAIEEIKQNFNSSTGVLHFVQIDLNDLATIKPGVNRFLQKEQRLDVLWNNAGVMTPPAGSTTKQGYEMQLGSNCLAHFLLSQLLLPIMRKTAKYAAKDSVRMCFAGSLVAELAVPKGVIDFDDINLEHFDDQRLKYGQSKAANILLGAEFARQHGRDGVLSLSFNPGNLKSGLQRHVSRLMNTISNVVLYPPIFGAYTELYSGLSTDLTAAHAGSYIIPWGRVAVLKENLNQAATIVEEGGSGAGQRFYDWCEKEVAPYM